MRGPEHTDTEPETPAPGAAASVSPILPARAPVRPATSDHVVRYYEDDARLCDGVAKFLAVGLAAGGPVCVVATPEHRAGIRERLERRGVDLDEAQARGQIVWLDARETLAQFMVSDLPDWTLFSELFGALLADCRRRFPLSVVRTYGEMVDVLWRDGNKKAALALEDLWNQLSARSPMSLLCAYSMANFVRTGDGDSFRDLCRAHDRVVPGDVEPRVEETAELDQLHQRQRLLENELEQRKALESALREALVREKEARAEAERSVRYNELFAGMLGHDLRNPLSAITTGANYVARLNQGPKATRAATRILASAERMGRMIDQLLDFTHIRAGGGLALAPTRFDLEQLCGRVKDELEAANPERSIVVDVEGDATGEWDRDRLEQVLSNVVGNALHHGAEGDTVHLRVDGRRPDVVELSVHNSGAIPSDVMPVLFEPFRGVARYHRTRGLGLGLFISQQIVAAHDGSIDVSSDVDAGTTFRLRLPRAPRPRPVAGPAPAVQPGARPS